MEKLQIDLNSLWEWALGNEINVENCGLLRCGAAVWIL
jgi:hypothetical protein